jgi:hypothetical protein
MAMNKVGSNNGASVVVVGMRDHHTPAPGKRGTGARRRCCPETDVVKDDRAGVGVTVPLCQPAPLWSTLPA